jgi:hypothetical protein
VMRCNQAGIHQRLIKLLIFKNQRSHCRLKKEVEVCDAKMLDSGTEA